MLAAELDLATRVSVAVVVSWFKVGGRIDDDGRRGEGCRGGSNRPSQLARLELESSGIWGGSLGSGSRRISRDHWCGKTRYVVGAGLPGEDVVMFGGEDVERVHIEVTVLEKESRLAQWPKTVCGDASLAAFGPRRQPQPAGTQMPKLSATMVLGNAR